MKRRNELETMKESDRTRRQWLALGLTLAIVFTVLSAARSPLLARAAGQTQGGGKASADASASKPTLEAAPPVTEFEVNGLKVLVKRRAGSQTVAAGLFMRGGALNIKAENAGVEALMLNLMSEASRGFPRERLRSELASLGTSISSGLNYDYSALTLASTRRHFDRSWEIFTDVALYPAFAAEDFERVKSRLVVSRSQSEDTPDALLQALQSRAAFAGHPYANDPHGTVASLKGLTLEDVRRYHLHMMQTARLLLVIVGDLDPQQMQKSLVTSFGKLPRGDYRPAALPPLSFAAPSVGVTARELQTNYVQGLFAAPSLASPEIYPMRIAAAILRDRVFSEVRIRRNLSYSPNAFLNTQGANTGGIYVTAVNANQAVKVMLDEIARLQREPIAPDEIGGVAQQYLTDHYLGQETNAAQAGELARFELLGGGWRNSLGHLDRLRAVTPADVQRVAKTYLRNLSFTVIGNPQQVDKSVFTAQPGKDGSLHQ
jgi:zinc protease